MTRRLLSALLGLTVAGTLVWGVVALQAIFEAERATALGALQSRRDALELYATDSLRSVLVRQIGEAEAARRRAEGDPRLDSGDLYLQVNGQQVLPPVVGYARSDGGTFQRFEQLANPEHVGVRSDADPPWSRRLKLRDDLITALRQNDRVALERAGRELLAERARSVIGAEREVPFTLAFLSLLDGAGQADPRYLGLLLHTGVADRQGNWVEPLQSVLLRRRAVFGERSFQQLVSAVVALSRKAGVAFDTFEQAAARQLEGPIAVPETPKGLVLIDGRWAVMPTESPDRRVGVRVDLPAVLRDATERMRRGRLIGPDDSLAFEPAARVDGVDFRVRAESRQWAADREAAQSAWRIKTALAVGTAALAGLLVVSVFWIWRRRQHYLELKSDFVSTVSHELRTPLASIRLMAETLERRLADTPRAKDYPTRIVKVVDGLSFLIENILSFNRIDKGRWVPRMASVVLADVLEHARQSVELGSREVVCTATDADLSLNADGALLKLLFENLYRNAVAYNDSEVVRIDTHVTRSNGQIQVTVRDNGRGVPEAARGRLFDAFFRPASSSGQRGSGLGLAICRRIARLHQGDLKLKASGPTGSVFEVTLR